MRSVLVLLALLLAAVQGCSTQTIYQDEPQIQQAQPQHQAGTPAEHAAGPATMIDMAPIAEEHDVWFEMAQAIEQANRLPWENAQAPPLYAQLPDFNVGEGGTAGQIGDCRPRGGSTPGVPSFNTRTSLPNCYRPTYYALLQTSIIPAVATGSATFTRASTAYQTDFELKRNLVLSGETRFQGARRVYNYFTKSEDITNAAWSVLNANITKVDATTINVTSVAAEATIRQNTPLPVFAGATHTARLSFKAARITGTGNVIVDVDDNDATTVTLTSTLRRYSTTARVNSGIFVDFTFTATGTYTITELQAESTIGQANTNPSEYVSSGVLSTPYHGAGTDSVAYKQTLNGNSVASNVVTEATGAAIVAGASGVAATAPVDAGGPFGYLSEGARTNNALWSRDWTNAAWVTATATVAKDQTGVDGVANAASSVLAVAGNDTVLQVYTAASATRTFGVLAKRITGTGTVSFTSDGVNYTACTLNTSTWVLCQDTHALLNPAFGVKIVTAGDKIAVDMAMLEDATFTSSPIPTTTVAVTRAADVLSYSIAGNASFTQGTLTAEAGSGNWADNIGDIIYIGDGGLSSDITGSVAPYPHLNMWDGTDEVEIGPFLVTGAMQKVAGTWGGTAMVTALSGAATTGSFDGALGTGTDVYIGTESAPGFSWFGPIRHAKLFPRVVPTAVLQRVTTP